MRPLVIAHRGASYLAPEHTFAAYDLALAQGADYIEQDLQRTSDGVLVVLHDETLDRTTRGASQNCTGAVATRTLNQIRTCDAGSWFNEAHPSHAKSEYADLRIPTLEEVLQRYGSRARYYIETKSPEIYPGMEEQLLATLRRHGISPDRSADHPSVYIQSFSAASLQLIKSFEPEWPLVQLTNSRTPPLTVATLDAIAQYANAIGPEKSSVTASLIQSAHEKCLRVHPYTIDSREEMASTLSAGADGIFTNRPDAGVMAAGPYVSSALPSRCRQ